MPLIAIGPTPRPQESPEEDQVHLYSASSTDTGQIEVGRWYHAVTVLGAAGDLHFYLTDSVTGTHVHITDGTRTSGPQGQNVTILPSGPRSDNYIGRVATPDPKLYTPTNMQLSGFRVWPAALSASEVQTLAAGGDIGRQPLVHLPFDDPPGSRVARDVSGNGRNGTIESPEEDQVHLYSASSTDTGQIEVGWWYHAVTVLGAAGDLHFYLTDSVTGTHVHITDGTRTSGPQGQNVTILPSGPRSDNYIGRVATPDPKLYTPTNMQLSGFRVWPAALSASEVQTLAAGGDIGRQPLVHLPFDDPPGSRVARDVSGNGRNGTIVGSVTTGSGDGCFVDVRSDPRCGLRSF
eukprot:tig00020816_g14090.t1